jgi:hypothetical protein
LKRCNETQKLTIEGISYFGHFYDQYNQYVYGTNTVNVNFVEGTEYDMAGPDETYNKWVVHVDLEPVLAIFDMMHDYAGDPVAINNSIFSTGGSFTFHHDENISTDNPELFFDHNGVVNKELGRMASQRQTVLDITKNKEFDLAAFEQYDRVDLTTFETEKEKSFWEVGWGHVAAFSGGTWDAWSTNSTFGLHEGQVDPQHPITYEIGQVTGDVASFTLGLIEMALGGAGVAGGTGLSATGAGAVVGVPAAVASGAVAAHGAGTSGNALDNFFTNSGDLIQQIRAGNKGIDNGYKYWNKTTKFNNVKVYQRDDIINPNMKDARGRTNLERMKKGLAPLGPDGKSINLHHMTQRNESSIAEVTQTFHKENSSVIHINPNTIPSGINRTEFNKWKTDYWKNRANDF